MKINRPAIDICKGDIIVIDSETQALVLSEPRLEDSEVIFEIESPEGHRQHRTKKNTIITISKRVMNKKNNRGGLRNPPGGRPKKPEGAMVSTSIRLPKDLLDRLNSNTSNRNEFIIKAIQEKIKRTKAP